MGPGIKNKMNNNNVQKIRSLYVVGVNNHIQNQQQIKMITKTPKSISTSSVSSISSPSSSYYYRQSSIRFSNSEISNLNQEDEYSNNKYLSIKYFDLKRAVITSLSSNQTFFLDKQNISNNRFRPPCSFGQSRRFSSTLNISVLRNNNDRGKLNRHEEIESNHLANIHSVTASFSISTVQDDRSRQLLIFIVYFEIFFRIVFLNCIKLSKIV